MDYSTNFNLLGISRGTFKIGEDKIGVFHNEPFRTILSSQEEPKKIKRNEIIYNNLCENMKEFTKDYIYTLIGHYHFGMHNPKENFSVIENGTNNALLFKAEIKNGRVENVVV